MRPFIVEFWHFEELLFSAPVEAVNEAAALILAFAKLHSRSFCQNWVIDHGYTITIRSG